MDMAEQRALMGDHRRHVDDAAEFSLLEPMLPVALQLIRQHAGTMSYV